MRFQSISIGGLKYKKPHFLNNEIDSINAMIDYFNSRIGQTEDSINRHELMALFDHKLTGRTVMETMRKWFYSTKGLQESSKGAASLWRKRWFNYMHENSITWVDPLNSANELFEFSSSWNISADNMKKLLFHDHTENFSIKRIGKKPNHEEVMQRSNTEIIQYLFSSTNKMWFSIPKDQIEGQLVKTLIRNSKFWGVFTELVEKDGSIIFEVIGPVQLVGKPTKYGKLLYALFYSSLPYFKSKLNLFLDVSYYDRSIQVCLPLFEFPSLLPLDIAFNQNLNSSFDSKIEERFSREFSRIMPHWNIKNEEVLVKKSRIFIPDFVLTYRNKTIYLEIVGFWIETYLKKKIEKIKWFSKHFDNIILLVDEKLEFPDNIVPTFRYDKRLSLKKLKEFILQNYEQKEFENFIDNLISKKDSLIRNIESSLSEKPVLKEELLRELLGTKSSVKTKEALTKLFGEREESNFTVFNWTNLIIKKSYLDNLGSLLEDQVPPDGISEENLFNYLKIDHTTFDTIISHFGYSKQYNSLTDITIYPRIKQKNV